MTDKVLRTKVRGVTNDNPNGINRQDIIKNSARAGDTIYLLPEPNNEYDPQAVAIWINKRILFKKIPLKLGYLSKEMADKFYDDIVNKRIISAKIVNITGGGDKARGVNIEIVFKE